MAGLLMKELIARGDLQRCLVVCPGSLAVAARERKSQGPKTSAFRDRIG
jgi:hypothetical protein